MEKQIKKPSLKDKIYNVLKEADKPLRMKQIYALLPTEKPHCIRARIYNHLVGDFKYNKASKNLFVRLEGSLYMLAEKLEEASND
jgi:predicted Zn-ribbon and HTH transcriptional regulator